MLSRHRLDHLYLDAHNRSSRDNHDVVADHHHDCEHDEQHPQRGRDGHGAPGSVL
jgi:hypothetical protein